MPSVTTQITYIVVGYAVLVAILALLAARRGDRPAWLDQMAWMLEFLLVIRALAGLGALSGDDQPGSMTTYVGYLLASVCVLPIALQSVKGDRAGWSSAVVAVAAVAVSVLVVRLQQTA